MFPWWSPCVWGGAESLAPRNQTLSSKRQGGTACHWPAARVRVWVLKTKTESVLPESEGNTDYLLGWFKTKDWGRDRCQPANSNSNAKTTGQEWKPNWGVGATLEQEKGGSDAPLEQSWCTLACLVLVGWSRDLPGAWSWAGQEALEKIHTEVCVNYDVSKLWKQILFLHPFLRLSPPLGTLVEVQPLSLFLFFF